MLEQGIVGTGRVFNPSKCNSCLIRPETLIVISLSLIFSHNTHKAFLPFYTRCSNSDITPVACQSCVYMYCTSLLCASGRAALSIDYVTEWLCFRATACILLGVDLQISDLICHPAKYHKRVVVLRLLLSVQTSASGDLNTFDTTIWSLYFLSYYDQFWVPRGLLSLYHTSCCSICDFL